MEEIPENMLKGFTGREQDLRAVERYSLYNVMLYRTNLFTHSLRVAAFTRAINSFACEVFGPTFDPIKAEILALVHDDAEIIFGDVQAGNKSKMTRAQLKEVKDAEMLAIEKIAQRFPKQVANYSYKQLLTEAANHSSLEAQVVCYADKYDALGEALHEIFAGNYYFTTHVHNEYGVIPIPPEYYTAYFGSFLKKYPAMAPLLQQPLDFFAPVQKTDYSSEVKHGKPYMPEDLSRPTGDHHYDAWRHIVLQIPNAELQRDLYVQKEFMR